MRTLLYVQSALFGWKHVNIFAIMPEDILHQDWNGLCAHLFACIDAWLDRHKKSKKDLIAQQGLIREALVFMRKQHGTNIPSQGLQTEKMTAEVKGAALACLLVQPSQLLTSVMLV